MQKILIVDNDPDLLDLLADIFTKEAIETVCCRNALAMFEQLQSFTPDLMIIDVVHSGVEGKLIGDMLRHRAALKKIPILITSVSKNDISNYASFGADGAIAKPFDLTGLKEMVSETYAAVSLKNSSTNEL